MPTESLQNNRRPLSRIARERRAQILDAALRCFARDGFHRASMAEVCTEAKMSPGSVYRYFRSKDDIIAGLAIAEHAYVEAFYETVRVLPSLRDAIDALIGYWIDGGRQSREPIEPVEPRELVMSDNPDSFVVYIEIFAEAARNPRIAAITRQYDEAQLAVVRSILEQAKARGEIGATASCDMLSRLLSATLDGLMFRCLYDKSLSPTSYRDETRQFLHRALEMKI